MTIRLWGTLVVVLLALAMLAPSASAQEITPGGTSNAQVDQYVGPEGGGGAAGVAGKLPFTGLMILPLVIGGVALLMIGSAVRNRASGPDTA
jgi:hypothetical protein